MQLFLDAKFLQMWLGLWSQPDVRLAVRTYQGRPRRATTAAINTRFGPIDLHISRW